MAGTSTHRHWIFATALVSMTMLGPLAIHMYLPIVPDIQRTFGISTGMAQLSLSVVMLVMAGGTLVYGSLSDRFGRKRVLVGGLLLFAAGSLICVLAGTFSWLLAGRLLQAAGAGAGVVLARAIARDVYGADRLAQVIAYITAAYVLGPMFAPPIGGLFADLFGWPSVFVFALVVCLAVIALTASILRETHAPAAVEHRTALRASYGRLLRSPVFVAYAMNPALTSMAFFSLASSANLLMADVYHRSATEFGLYFTLLPVGFMVGNFASGRLGSRFASGTMVVVGNVVAVATSILLWLVVLVVPGNPIWIFVGGSLIGVGQGLSIPFAQAAAINVDRELTGTASGIVVFLQFLGAAAAVQIVGAVYDKSLGPILFLLLGGSVLALISGLFAAAYGRRTARTQPAE